MLKQDQIENVPTSDGNGAIKIYKPLQCEVIVDDEVPYDKSMEADDFYNLSQEEKEKLDKEYQEFLDET